MVMVLPEQVFQGCVVVARYLMYDTQHDHMSTLGVVVHEHQAVTK